MIETEVDQCGPEFLIDLPADSELLADLLGRGRLPGEQALRYAIEIGSVLSRAHAQGLVHGGLSPSTIAITPAGARVLQATPVPEGRSAPYTSPEQVRGEAPDTRSDIFSYGAVLYAMASGKRPFPGTGADLDQAILESPPPLFSGKTKFHLAMEGVIASCLAKDPAVRRQRIRNAVIELRLESPKSKPARVAPPGGTVVAAPPLPSKPADGAPWPPRPERRRRKKSISLKFGLALIALVMITVAAMAAAAFAFLRPRQTAQVVSFRVTPPENTSYPGPPSVSPDGRLLAFSAANPEGRRMLWLRPLDSLRSTPIFGTEGASSPFWSPDSRDIAFFSNQSLKRVPAAGGPVSTICPVEVLAGGGDWNSDGTILFAPGLTGGLYRVRANGGTPLAVLAPNPAAFQHAFLWPRFLPDSKHFILFVSTEKTETTGVYAGSIAPPSIRQLFASETNAVFSAMADSRSRSHGYLLFVHDRAPTAQPFNASSMALEGDPISIGDDIGSLRSLSLAPISVSDNATLVYQTVGGATRQMVWLDRTGRQISTVKETGDWGPPKISPDGTRAAAAKLAPDGHADIWLLNSDGSIAQFTNSPVHEGSPVWSPDGSRLAFFGSATGERHFELFVKSVNGSKVESLFKSEVAIYPTDWSRDGRHILFSLLPPAAKADIWAISTADRRAGPILDTINAEGYASLSPDGKWLAYQSDESGKIEIYVQAFEGIASGTRRHWQVSVGGGGMPRWRDDGRELFYVTGGGRMTGVAVRPLGGTFAFDPPQTLFQTRAYPKTWNLYDVSPDGQRFLMNLPLEMSNASTITVLTNWTEKLKRVASN